MRNAEGETKVRRFLNAVFPLDIVWALALAKDQEMVL